MPAPARICGTIVHAMLGAGRNASAAAPPASSSAPASARACGGPGERGGGERGEREHRDAERGPQRRDREAGDELDHEQEQHRGERGGGRASAAAARARRRGRRSAAARPRGGIGAAGRARAPARRSGLVRLGCLQRGGGRRPSAPGRGECERDLDDEDRAPVEELGQHAADRRAGGGADQRGAEPPAAAVARAARVEHLERGQQRGRGARRLDRAEEQQHPQGRGERAADGSGREDDHARPAGPQASGPARSRARARARRRRRSRRHPRSWCRTRRGSAAARARRSTRRPVPAPRRSRRARVVFRPLAGELIRGARNAGSRAPSRPSTSRCRSSAARRRAG